MPTYKEYQAQIAELEALAEQARQNEIAEARRQIRELMQSYSLSASDLLQSDAKSTSGKKSKTVLAKYKDPESGLMWTGRGRAPRWLDGKNKDDFLIK